MELSHRPGQREDTEKESCDFGICVQAPGPLYDTSPESTSAKSKDLNQVPKISLHLALAQFCLKLVYTFDVLLKSTAVSIAPRSCRSKHQEHLLSLRTALLRQMDNAKWCDNLKMIQPAASVSAPDFKQ